MDNSAGCSFSVDENKLVLRVSRSDFELIKSVIEENQAKQKKLTIIRIEIMPEDGKLRLHLKATEQLTGSILLRVEPE